MPTPMPTFRTNSAQNGASRHESKTGPAQKCLDFTDLLGPARHDAATRCNLPNPKVARSSRAGVISLITSGRSGYESGRCVFFVRQSQGGTVSGTYWVRVRLSI